MIQQVVLPTISKILIVTLILWKNGEAGKVSSAVNVGKERNMT